MLKILLVIIFSFISILCDDPKNITIKDKEPIEEQIPETHKPLFYRIKYEENKTYIHVNVISEISNIYIVYCTTIDCPNSQLLISNLRENDQNLYIQKIILPVETMEGYIYINSYDQLIKGKVIFSSTDYIELNRDKSLTYYNADVQDLDKIRVPALQTNNLITLSVYSLSDQIFGTQIFYCDEDGCDTEIQTFNVQYGYTSFFNEKDYQKPNSYYEIQLSLFTNSYYIINCKVFKDGHIDFLANSLAFTGYFLRDLLDKQCINIKVKEENEDQQINVHLMSFYKSFSYNIEGSSESGIVEYDKTFHLKRKNQKLCITTPNVDENITVYFLEVIDLNDESNFTNYYTPQISGYIYNRLMSPQKIVYFNYGKQDSSSLTSVTFTLKVKKGKPVLYQAICNTYPNCEYKFENIKSLIAEKKLKETNLINNIYIMSTDIDSQRKITSYKQTLYAAACYGEEECEYESLISSFNSDIILKPNERFINFLKKDDFHTFKYNNTDEKVTSIIISVYTFSGDINIINNKEGEEDYLTKPVYLNKQEFNYHISNPNDTYNLVGDYNININPIKNDSFYSFEMTIFKEETEKKKINLMAGSTYIETLPLNEENTYILKFLQNKELQKNIYVSFFALNCKVTIKKITNSRTLIESGYFTRDEILTKDKEFDQRFSDYTIKAEEMDSVRTSQSEPCMVYISSLEDNFNKSSFNIDDRYLIIGQNIQYASILTEKTKGIKYLFPISSNYDGDILLKIEAINQPEFNIYYYYYEGNENKKDNLNTPITVTTSTSIILEKPNQYIQTKNSITKIFIEVTAKDEYLNQHIEFSFVIKQEIVSPSYIKKGLMKTDVISGRSSVYYYTDVNNGEEGEVIINFERGTGNIYARIVKKDNEDEDADWMGRIHLPKANDDDLLIVDDYSHKVLYFEDDTKKCSIVGCFLLITIENTVTRLIEGNEYLYDISLYAKVTNGDKKQVVNIALDRFIIGYFPANNENKVLQHYFTFRLPNDAEMIVFELQSDLVNLYVNDNKNLPSPSDAKYEYKSDYKPNSVFILKNTDLKKNKWFTICVAIDKRFEYYIENIFSLRIRAPPKGKIDLIPLNSDQNTLCNYDGENLCYFISYIKPSDKLKNLYLHAFQDKKSQIEIYVKNLTSSELNIKEKLPNANNTDFKSTGQLETDYFLIGLEEVKYDYLVIAVYAKEKGIITLLSTLYTYADKLNIDASAYTLFHLYGDMSITLNFPNNNIYIAHFVSVNGIGKIVTNDTNEQYLIKGSNDILGMVMPIEHKREVSITASGRELGFYVYIEPRTVINYDEIKYGTSGEVYYDECSFPLIYYIEVPQDYDNVLITLNLKNFSLLNNTINEKVDDKVDIDNLSFEFKGYITDKVFITKKKADHEINPGVDELNIEGKYNPFLKIAQIFFSKKDIEEPKKTKKYIYITLMNKNKKKYKDIKVEYSVTPLSSKVYIAPYNQYIFGNLKKENKNIAIYRIRKDDEIDKFMRFEFSSNDEFEKFEVAFLQNPPEKESKEFVSDIKVEKPIEIFMKKIYIVTLETVDNKEINEFYFVVYSKQTASDFAFKYYSSDKKENFPNYTFSPKIAKNINSNNSITITLDAIKKKTAIDEGFVPTTFIAVVIGKLYEAKKFNYISYDSVNYNIYKKEYYNISDKEIKIKLDNFPNDNYYDLVVCGITNEEHSELFLYNVLENPLNYDKPMGTGPKIAIILLVIFIVLLIGIFGFIFFKMKKENADLNDRINRMSGYNVVSEDPENLNYHKQD